MKIAEVKRLVGQFAKAQIDEAVIKFETDRQNPLDVQGDDDGEKMSHLLAAQFVKKQMEKGVSLNEALREYSRRVRGILS